MTKGAKIALGCGCAVLLVGAAIIAVFGVGAFWAKAKLHQVAGNFDKLSAQTKEIQTFERKANANPYSAPADGVIPEARFVKFLETRKQVYGVYERFKPELDALEAKGKSKTQPSLSGALEAGGKVAQLFTELRLAQVQALADVGMSEREYRDIQVAVYKTAWAAESEKQSGKTPSQAMREAERSAEAQQSGLSEEDRRKLHESMAQLGQAAQALEVPKANIDLFRKYEADIKKYAMNGLELIGL